MAEKNIKRKVTPDKESQGNNKRAQEVEYWTAFWPTVQEASLKSEENIDKKVFSLSVGALGLELTLWEFVWQDISRGKILAFLAAFFFVIALVLNLYIHLYGRRTQFEQSKMIKSFITDESSKLDSWLIYSKIEKQNQNILVLNKISSIVVIIGILLLLVFAYLILS